MNPHHSSHYRLILRDGATYQGASLHVKQNATFVLCSLFEYPKGRTRHKVEFPLELIKSLHLIANEPSSWDPYHKVVIPAHQHKFLIIP